MAVAVTCPVFAAVDQPDCQFLTLNKNRMFSAENSFVAAKSNSGLGLSVRAALSDGSENTLVSIVGDGNGWEFPGFSIEGFDDDVGLEDWYELMYSEPSDDSNDTLR